MPFEEFAPPIRQATSLRSAITAATYRAEREAVLPLLEDARLSSCLASRILSTARRLVEALRREKHLGGVDALINEYALSTQEGVALMCLAEALLRIPDTQTRDALIRDKIADGNWRAHIGGERPLFVNAATWGLVITGQIVQPVKDNSMAGALTRLIARAGEPVIRSAVNLAMRLLGEQFVIGETIGEALDRAGSQEKRGFTYSYDMLGEAAMTAADADAYNQAYTRAIHEIGKRAEGDTVYERPGISIKLSALHPRYSRAKAGRMIAELLPRAKALALLARSYGIGLNIDAEEAERLELSLDILESLALDSDLAGWDGLGFVVQAYGKRSSHVIDWLRDLALRADRRIMVRLVKGAYWDAEIKRAQVAGLADFPVFTRKAHTDVSYLACARKLLDARAELFPQFATHNAYSLAAIYHLAGDDFTPGDYEFQCLHGMGQALYDEVIEPDKLSRPCRVYAPVGTHETLLAYLVRRLLENGANSSFVNQIADRSVDIDSLIQDPVAKIEAMEYPGNRHPDIALPSDIFTERHNSKGLDVNDEATLTMLEQTFKHEARRMWKAEPTVRLSGSRPRNVTNPADRRDIIGSVVEISTQDVGPTAERAFAIADTSTWSEMPVEERSARLEYAADIMEHEMPALLALTMREAGKTLPNAVDEVREAIDFLRYYAKEARYNLKSAAPRGPIVCISPWNFPLAIFTGQVAAALVAGNPVVAKPAEETPLIAAEAVRILHEAGIPRNALQVLFGDGALGAALVANHRVAGVLFTGSTEVAKLIERELAGRLDNNGRPLTLIAETGGQNAMLVDSSALPEQVVAGVIGSAFDSAGQRCSALRILCLQDDTADRIVGMLKGAMNELEIGPTDRLSTDVGPVITNEARDMIEAYIAKMEERDHAIHRLPLPGDCGHGTFVAPTLIEIDDISQLGREVFGPVLHVLRWKRKDRDDLVDAINATGYGLTFGLHTRLDTVASEVLSRVHVGNRYVNRNMVGAVVGVQPFGGRGLSGTGPKAGGPLYLTKLAADVPGPLRDDVASIDPALRAFSQWLEDRGETEMAAIARDYGDISPVGLERDLAGPVGERNFYGLQPRGMVLLHAETERGLFQQIAAVLSTGNRGTVRGMSLPCGLPSSVMDRLTGGQREAPSAALYEGGKMGLLALLKEFADTLPHVVSVQAEDDPAQYHFGYRSDWLCEEISTSIDTTAAGGNASLMVLGS